MPGARGETSAPLGVVILMHDSTEKDCRVYGEGDYHILLVRRIFTTEDEIDEKCLTPPLDNCICAI